MAYMSITRSITRYSSTMKIQASQYKQITYNINKLFTLVYSTYRNMSIQPYWLFLSRNRSEFLFSKASLINQPNLLITRISDMRIVHFCSVSKFMKSGKDLINFVRRVYKYEMVFIFYFPTTAKFT